MTRDQLLLFIKQEIASESGISLEAIHEDTGFHSLGLDSLSAVVVLNKIETEFNIELSPLHFWDYPTPGAFADFLLREHIR